MMHRVVVSGCKKEKKKLITLLFHRPWFVVRTVRVSAIYSIRAEFVCFGWSLKYKKWAYLGAARWWWFATKIGLLVKKKSITWDFSRHQVSRTLGKTTKQKKIRRTNHCIVAMSQVSNQPPTGWRHRRTVKKKKNRFIEVYVFRYVFHLFFFVNI
jgi:hypothetical protein